jgi:transcriptional regulator with PAS, ATPase and Fis domain
MESLKVAGSGDEPLIVGRSPAILRAKALIVPVAKSGAPSLVLGESGTGKELFIVAIHRASERTGALIRVNCAAIPETLFESELEGHEKGAYSGAYRARPGLIEEANGGTLFLDEIAELSLVVQAKLLRVLDRGEIRRVGANRTRAVDVRIVAASNRDLLRMVEEGLFRQDLYARLDVMQIHLPPLRERDGDIPLLVEHFAGSRPVTPEALALFEAYHWPRNVRELSHAIFSAGVLAGADPIGPEYVPNSIRQASAGTRAREGRIAARLMTLGEVEREHILAVIAHTNGNVTAAAGILGIDRHTLAKKLTSFQWNHRAAGGTIET